MGAGQGRAGQGRAGNQQGRPAAWQGSSRVGKQKGNVAAGQGSKRALARQGSVWVEQQGSWTSHHVPRQARVELGHGSQQVAA